MPHAFNGLSLRCLCLLTNELRSLFADLNFYFLPIDNPESFCRGFPRREGQ